MFYFLQTETIATTVNYIDKVKGMAIDYAPKILGAIVFYIIGTWIINLLVSGMKRVMAKRHLDPSLQTFLGSIVKITLLVLLLLSIFNMLGFSITSFAALLAGAGLAIGAALNGSLGNLAGGVMLMIFKPFKVGDFIEAQGVMGSVTEMGTFNTVVLSPENKTIYLPNGALSTGIITNFTNSGFLRVDLTMAIAPDQDIDKARKVAIDAMLQNPKVLKTPMPEVSVSKVADGMVTLAIRPYTTQPDYWDVYFGAQELVKKAWDANGVQGPTPHRVIITKQG